MTPVAKDNLDVFRTLKTEAQLQEDLSRIPHHTKKSKLKEVWPFIKSISIK